MSSSGRTRQGALRRLREYVLLYLGLGYLGMICLLWTPFAMVFYPLLPARAGRRLGRFVINQGFNSYIRFLTLIGACRFDLAALDKLRGQGPLILAPNHPSLLDAVMVISRLPDVACIMKAGLMDNIFLGAGARLARYIRNDSPLRMVGCATTDLSAGSFLLVFPEGTRTTRMPVNPLLSSVGLISRRSGVPVQTIFIETDSPYLCKGWPLFRKPEMPVVYRVRLGRRFDPPSSVQPFMTELERYFVAELEDAVLPQPPERDGGTMSSSTI
ncbi:lysophospholipid acyltransferase family protein [Aromatoleum petrolei]|uniref:1-acyl-sn-glycerol-3-phosphate acyltransferase n=1 Tax=Aromatoleum petrolei TaxID=76116 RepID=A0ABX1MJA0_9RHOO|nr:lysophospholipid acyltransferase family protein [Aromatoleum petrolei]NMF88024.1 1-acyl-sn-glycerol-3-phosphate acyltransferase [Aromatoleum petrolei]